MPLVLVPVPAVRSKDEGAQAAVGVQAISRAMLASRGEEAMHGWRLTLLFLVLGILGCLLTWKGPARADAAERALWQLCPRLLPLAPVLAEIAHRQLIHPAKLAANVKAESRCRFAAINPRTGAVGLGQILPRGSANQRHFTPDELLNPAVNLDLTAAHLNRYLMICGTFEGAVHVYHGYRKCRGWKRDLHVLKVLRFYRSVFER